MLLIAFIVADIPQILSDPNINSSNNSVTVSWIPTKFTPDNYTVSYSCQLICNLLSPMQQISTVDGLSNTHVLLVASGSFCTINVTAVFGSFNSNSVTTSTNTTSAGAMYLNNMSCQFMHMPILMLFLAPTGTPGGLTSTSVERRSLSVVWGTVPCPHQRGPITGYRLRYSNGTSIVNTTGEGSRQHVLTGLTPFTNYSVQVAAVNDGGTGPYSTLLTVETLQDGE